MKGFRIIVFIFIVIYKTFLPTCLLAFFRCLSNSGTNSELRVQQITEEGRTTYRPKRYGNNNKDGFP